LTFALPDPTSSSLLISETIFDNNRNIGRFIREAGDGDYVTSTEKCPEAKYEDFFSRYDNCMNAAQAIIDEVLQDDFADIENAMCRSTDAEVKCMDTLLPECFDSEKYNNIRRNYITKKLQAAYNITFLGQTYIDSCPILSREEPKIVREITGSNKCDFTTFESNWRSYKSCESAADKKIKSMIALIDAKVFPDPVAAYTKAQCDFADSLYNTCEEDTIFQCYSDNKINEINENDVTSMARRQELIRRGLEDFSYETCPWYKNSGGNSNSGGEIDRSLIQWVKNLGN